MTSVTLPLERGTSSSTKPHQPTCLYSHEATKSERWRSAGFISIWPSWEMKQHPEEILCPLCFLSSLLTNGDTGRKRGFGKNNYLSIAEFLRLSFTPLAKATERTWVFLLWLPVLIAKFLLLEILPGEFPQFPCLPLITRNYVPMPHRGASRSSEENMHCGKIMRGFQNALQQHTYLVIPWCPSQ